MKKELLISNERNIREILKAWAQRRWKRVEETIRHMAVFSVPVALAILTAACEGYNCHFDENTGYYVRTVVTSDGWVARTNYRSLEECQGGFQPKVGRGNELSVSLGLGYGLNVHNLL